MVHFPRKSSILFPPISIASTKTSHDVIAPTHISPIFRIWRNYETSCARLFAKFPSNSSLPQPFFHRYVWDNLATGYIQGMCDLVAPLLVTFDEGEWSKKPRVSKGLYLFRSTSVQLFLLVDETFITEFSSRSWHGWAFRTHAFIITNPWFSTLRAYSSNRRFYAFLFLLSMVFIRFQTR